MLPDFMTVSFFGVAAVRGLQIPHRMGLDKIMFAWSRTIGLTLLYAFSCVLLYNIVNLCYWNWQGAAVRGAGTDSCLTNKHQYAVRGLE